MHVHKQYSDSFKIWSPINSINTDFEIGSKKYMYKYYSYSKLMVTNYDLFVFRYWLFNQNQQHRIIQYTPLFNCICYICYICMSVPYNNI